MNFEKIIEAGVKLGLSGDKILEFVAEREKAEIEERTAERESQIKLNKIFV